MSAVLMDNRGGARRHRGDAPGGTGRTRCSPRRRWPSSAALHRRFEPVRQQPPAGPARCARPRFDAGALPDFRADTAAIRAADWRVAPLPAALQDRRVEITGPVDPKMVINALNSGAKVYMADFEDSTVADLGQPDPGPAGAARRRRRHPRLHRAGNGKHYALKPDAERPC